VSSVVVPTKLSDLTGSNTSNLNLNSNKIINVVDPVNAQDGATKNYVDTKVATVSGGSTLTQTLTTPVYSGSLADISCKILWMTNVNTNTTGYYLHITNLNNLIFNLGGNPSNIRVYNLFSITGSTTLTYDPSFDVVIWAPANHTSPANVISLLNTYYSNGKGVVISMFANSTNTNLTKNISSSSGESNSSSSFSQVGNNSHPILTGVTSIVNPGYYNSIFSSQNGSSLIGYLGTIINLLAYLDDPVYGRRVDLNYFAAYGSQNDTTTTGVNRATLQALLWAARKINSSSTSTSNFDPNNMQLVSNLNCNNKRLTNCADPVNNGDVLTLNYYNNLRPSGILYQSSNYIYLGYAFNNLRFFYTGSATNSASQCYEIIIVCNKDTSNPSYYVKGQRFDGVNNVTFYSNNGSSIGPFIIGMASMTIQNGYLFLSNNDSTYTMTYNVI